MSNSSSAVTRDPASLPMFRPEVLKKDESSRRAATRQYGAEPVMAPISKGWARSPGIAGRSPSYIVRQLYDFKHGARAGADSAQMKPSVEKLSIRGMISLAAYAASLEP